MINSTIFVPYETTLVEIAALAADIGARLASDVDGKTYLKTANGTRIKLAIEGKRVKLGDSQ